MCTGMPDLEPAFPAPGALATAAEASYSGGLSRWQRRTIMTMTAAAPANTTRTARTMPNTLPPSSPESVPPASSESALEMTPSSGEGAVGGEGEAAGDTGGDEGGGSTGGNGEGSSGDGGSDGDGGCGGDGGGVGGGDGGNGERGGGMGGVWMTTMGAVMTSMIPSLALWRKALAADAFCSTGERDSVRVTAWADDSASMFTCRMTEPAALTEMEMSVGSTPRRSAKTSCMESKTLASKSDGLPAAISSMLTDAGRTGGGDGKTVGGGDGGAGGCGHALFSSLYAVLLKLLQCDEETPHQFHREQQG